ncbi:MAG TPA: hypothetical protein VF161_12490 [Steroidobacteraceae bacterium]
MSIVLSGTIGHAGAYEIGTHAQLTEIAVNRSVLADPVSGPLAALGVTDLAAPIYRSIPPRDRRVRTASTTDLVALGAIYEDHPDPRSFVWPPVGPSEYRFLRHFLDPQQGDRGLLGSLSSREWVLEDDGDISNQEFSLRDTLDFYFLALTSRTAEAREHELVLLLQSIGRAVHHLQDMAQPAHTRDDLHPPFDDDQFEIVTERQFGNGARPLPDELPYGSSGLDLRDFDTAAKFWTHSGKGLAEFSSRNFVSHDTNFIRLPQGVFTDSEHPLPAYPADPQFETTTLRALGVSGPHADAVIQFLGLPVYDPVSGASIFNPRAAALSYFSHELIGISPTVPYTLNRYTYEEVYRLLLPRAIAYSAALINYFFRGRMELESYSVSGSQVQLVIRNVSAGSFVFADAPAPAVEEFSLYYDALDSERRRLALTEDDLAGQSVGSSATRSFTFTMPADVDAAKDEPFLLVFNGIIGNEPGISALAFGPASGALLVTPNYLPADGVAGGRLLVRSNGTWRVGSAGAVAGNIDWRGHNREDVLSWHGPQGRYFGEPGPVVSPNIYSHGKLLCSAPAPVIGAAIASDNGRRFLIAATQHDDQSLRIYRRPYQPSYDRDGLYDRSNNPLGWQLLHTQPGGVTSPMFFNASGTEAQVFAGLNRRYKFNIAGTAVTVTELSNIGSVTRVWTSTNDEDGGVTAEPAPARNCLATNWVCVGGRGPCVDEDTAVPSGEVCLMYEQSEAAWTSKMSEERTTQRVEAATVLCADYEGDEEVLCVIEPSPEENVVTSLDETQWHATRRDVQGNYCGDRRMMGPHELRHLRSERSVNELGLRMLRIGSRVIPISGTRGWREKEFDSRAQWDLGTGPSPVVPIAQYRYDAERSVYDSKLLYADARYGIVVYEEHVRTTREHGEGTSEVSDPGTGDPWFLHVPVTRAIRTTTRLLALADREYELRSESEETPPESLVLIEEAGFRGLGIMVCEDPPAWGSTSTSTQEWYPLEFVQRAIHLQLYEGPHQSLSALSPDTFVASIPIWVREPDGSYRREGTWNHLTGGALDELLPTAPQNSAYVPTGVVR